jgi:hypothetical protein
MTRAHAWSTDPARDAARPLGQNSSREILVRIPVGIL